MMQLMMPFEYHILSHHHLRNVLNSQGTTWTAVPHLQNKSIIPQGIDGCSLMPDITNE
jgi:hypothetical protein